MEQKKIIGIIGGIAPASTVNYYQLLVSGFQNRIGTRHYPSILINSIDMTRMLELLSNKETDLLVDYLAGEIQRLKNGGADFAVMASNTPHVVFDRIQLVSPIPLISIVRATVDYAQAAGFKRLGLFGTKFTMQGGFYQSAAAESNINLFIPDAASQDYIHDRYINELVKEVVMYNTRQKFKQIAGELKKEYAIDRLILGGTELPLLLNQSDFNDIKLLDTTLIHVNSIIDYALK